MKGTSLVAFLKSGEHDGAYENNKSDLFYALQLMGTNAVIYLEEMLELAQLDLPPTKRGAASGLAVDTLIRIGSAVAEPVARQMSDSEATFWSGQEILLELKDQAYPAIPILREMLTTGAIPSGRSTNDVLKLLMILADRKH